MYQMVSDLSDQSDVSNGNQTAIKLYCQMVQLAGVVFSWFLHLTVNQTVQLDITLLWNNSRAQSSGSTCSVTTREHNPVVQQLQTTREHKTVVKQLQTTREHETVVQQLQTREHDPVFQWFQNNSRARSRVSNVIPKKRKNVRPGNVLPLKVSQTCNFCFFRNVKIQDIAIWVLRSDKNYNFAIFRAWNLLKVEFLSFQNWPKF